MRILPAAFLISLVSTSYAQTDSLARQDLPPALIDTVIIAGNEKTKDYVILNEMTLRPGSVATPEAIEFDRNRIYSLGLFTRVDIFYDMLEGQRFLYVEVRERWYLIPLPLFGFRDGDPKKLFFGGGLLHNNVGGRNQKLFAALVFGYNPSASLFFSDPLIDRENGLFFSVNLSYSRVRNQSEAASALTGDFDELHYDIGASLGKRLSLYQTAGITLGFQRIQVDDYFPGRTVSPSGHDGFLYASASYSYDSRDLREYASQGGLISLFITKSGFGETELSFTRFGADLRRYTPLPLNLVFAARAFGTGVSGGPVPTYARSYFGYGERIRGYYNTVFEGENILGTTLELRYPLLQARTITVTALPLPPEFSVWRFGVSAALFGDAGVVWFRGDRLQLRSFASGYGAGLVFLLPYSYVVRLEYALNEYRRGQFIFNLRGAI
jgi:outer membrane protein assembly factor BamA